jgi:uncharacterized protein YbjQ (UPF0145 family)
MIELIIFVSLLLVGYIFGQMIEQSHYRSILKREALLRNIPLIASKKLPDEFTPCTTSLVSGNVVISVDFFKKFVAGLRNLVGGRVTTFEGLIDRARREALLRMREEARLLGANYVFNVKMETSSISKGQSGTIGSVEVLAYGTAIKLDNNQSEKPVPVQVDTGLNLRPK